jgi:mRNA-degrading endonuclease toxin of MazEF toxin-antitoxin module
MAYRFGDVIVVPFPFTDQTTTKKRPAVVISSEAYQRERPDVILMAVTSQVLAGADDRRDLGGRLAGSGSPQAFRHQTHRRDD